MPSRGRSVAVPIRTLKPAVIVNAAAYTQVDKAESDSEGSAFSVNAEAVGRIAAWSAENGCQVNPYLHGLSSSTGLAQTPYESRSADQPTGGLRRVQAGWRAADTNSQASQRSAVVRTFVAVLSEYGSNFVKTMLRLMRRQRSTFCRQ